MAVLTSTAGLVATIGATGLTDLSLNGTRVLFGTLSAENASSRFSIPGETALGAVTGSAVLASNARSVIVLQAHAKARVQYVYTLDGEDLTITARVTNNTGMLITVLGFTGLYGDWEGGDSTGLGGGVGFDFIDTGLQKFHPSASTRVGAAYRTPTGASYGVCGYPINMGLVKTLVQFYQQGDFPTPGHFQATLSFLIAPSQFRFPPATFGIPGEVSGQNADSLHATPAFSFGIHAGETYTCTFGIRVSADTSWQHLLAPYKAQFNATFGPCQYAASRDDRPICVAFEADSAFVVPTTNPYGFNTGFGDASPYRFDLSGDPWCDMLIPKMTAAGCQGSIHWLLNGWDTRYPGINGGGINYSVDVQTLPPEVITNGLPDLVSRFATAGLRLGRESRPAHIKARGAYSEDYPYLLMATTTQALVDLLLRWDTAVDLGFTLFYMDSFIDELTTHFTLKVLREHWGPTVLVFTEHFTDVSMIYGGVYEEVGGPNGGPYTSTSAALLEICRWITPHTSAGGVNRANSGQDFSAGLLDYYYQHNLILMVSDQDLHSNQPALAAALASRNATYLVANQYPDS